MKYLSVTQLAEKWCISTRRIQILCGEDRIPGAVRIGHSWAIPADAEKPADARIKSGKYVKRRPAAEKSDGLPPRQPNTKPCASQEGSDPQMCMEELGEQSDE